MSGGRFGHAEGEMHINNKMLGSHRQLDTPFSLGVRRGDQSETLNLEIRNTYVICEFNEIECNHPEMNID